MDIITIENERTRYWLTAELAANGDVVLFGHDLSPGLEATFGWDEYEYFYTVLAANVPRLRAELHGDLLTAIKTLLEPHGISASTQWKEWLIAHAVPYEFAVR